MAEFLVAEGVGEDISHEGLRVLLRQEGVTFQRLKSWKWSKDPRYAAKKARTERLYAIADREITPADDDPEIVFCVDEFGPLNLRPRPGRQWAAVGGKGKEPDRGRSRGCAPPTPAKPGCGTCSPPWSWAKASSTGTSSRARPGPVPGVLPLPSLVLVKPYRGAVHGVAVLHARRDRPRQPP